MGRHLGCFVVLSMTVWAAGSKERAWGQSIPSLSHDVVINEIHYDPDIKTELVEFVELYNTSASDVNLVAWQLCDGIRYQFESGAVLPAGGYVVVAQDWLSALTKWPQLAKKVGGHEQAYGPFEGRLGNDGQTIALCDPYSRVVDRVTYKLGFPWPTVGDRLTANTPGTGASIQLIHPGLDNALAGSWRSALPTPGARNVKVYSDRSVPDIEQVEHSPYQPGSGQVVTLRAQVTDPAGVRSVTCSYQRVDPGQYVGLQDAAYTANWTTVPMHDSGQAGDLQAGDGIYSVQLPADVQVNRRLVRYRITAKDSLGVSVTVPYADDPQPNFAYLVHDGVPAWSGAINPNGAAPLNTVVEYSEDVMNSVPVYHLISKKTDVEAATWVERYGGSEYKWWGTLVYDGKVYDHIRYRARGGCWRYSMGKNMWKFDFNRGHAFEARDDYGQGYKTTWKKLNLGACIQQGSFGQRGEQGMFEAASFKMFNMAGVPASKTNWASLRVIDERYEDGMLNAPHPPLTDGGTQYDGDFWGLYLAVEQVDGRFLDEHDLPDGNLYKMEAQYGELNNQGPTAETDGSDIRAFKNTYETNPGDSWWGSNVNLESYYGLYAVYNAVHHGDITSKNHFFYLNPEPTTNEWGTNNLWWQLPWDLDLTWTTYYGGLSDPFSRAGVLNHPLFGTQARNRVREICDLLFFPDQMNQLIDELAAVVADPGGGLSMVDADRAMWDYHWVMGDAAYPKYTDQAASFKAGQDRFYKAAEQAGLPRSFAGMVQLMKNYVVTWSPTMASLCADPAIPATPKVAATCGPAYPATALTFSVGPFSDPQGSQTFAAMQWRIAEVEPFSQFAPSKPSQTVLVDAQQPWRYFKGRSAPSSDPAAWRQLRFNDMLGRTAWLEGPMPIGYGKGFLQTVLSDMRNGYSTVYLRKAFSVADLASIGSLQLEARYAHGFVAWINGLYVASDNVSGPELPFNATALVSKEVSGLTAFPIADPATVLKAGDNVLAVQVLNVSATSGDCYFDARLVAKAPTDGDQVVRGRPGKYEVQAAWQSDPVTPFDSHVRIPAGAVEPGRTYRVRCRMEDTTGRWSHWSDPVQFVAGAAEANAPRLPLQVTEIMYNPPASPVEDGWDRDEFEFIELMNVGSTAIDLSGVQFVEGITFDFAGCAVTELDPGQFVLVVENQAAFECRYGAGLSSHVAGQYQGKLSNGGEKIKLVDLQTGALAEFEYRDKWYDTTDGQGRSLVMVDPYAVRPDQLGQKASWRASAWWGGSPGALDLP